MMRRMAGMMPLNDGMPFIWWINFDDIEAEDCQNEGVSDHESQWRATSIDVGTNSVDGRGWLGW